MTKDLDKGKGGTFYTPFPLLALASDNRNTFMCAGGGGSGNTKEKPNLVHAQLYDETTGSLNTIAALNTDKSVVYHIAYSAATGLWLASAKSACKVLSLDAGQNTITEICEFQTEETGPDKDRFQNFAKYSPDGSLIVTGGTDGILKLFKAGKQPTEAPELQSKSEYPADGKPRELIDADFSPDSKFVASTDSTGACRIYDTSKGLQSVVVQLKFTSRYVKKGPVFMKRVRFFKGEDGSNQLLVGAGGPRGPSCVAIFAVDGTMRKEVQVDPKILKYMEVDATSTHFAIGNVEDEGGGKSVWTLPGLSLVKRVNKISSLPVESVAFLGASTCVSGSGDNSIHLLNTKGGGGAAGCLRFLLLAIMITFIVFLFLRIGLKGAAVGQGSGEL